MTTDKDAPKTTTVFHPTLNVSNDVETSDVKDWTEAGWLLEEPKRG